MTITVICDVLGKENNGLTIAAMNLIRYLKSKGHIVRVVCGDEDKRGEKDYYVVRNRDFGVFNDYLAKNGVSLAKPEKDILYKAISGADVVHVMLPFSLGRAGVKISRELGIPVCAGFHLLAENFSAHLSMSHIYLLNRLTYAYFHKMYKECDCTHYVTQYLRDIYEGMYGSTHGYVISNGVNGIFKPDPAKYNPQDKIKILYTGRYSKEKSHKVLIKAVELSKYKDKIQLIFAGTGPLKEKLEKQCENLPVKPVFAFFTREEMAKTDNSAYLYVHAAEIEAEGIGCLEAIACGVVPIISDSKKSATKNYAIDEKSLFRCNDPQDLASKIDWWIEHSDERAKYSKKYIEMAQDKFDHEKCMHEMERMLIETAAKKQIAN